MNQNFKAEPGKIYKLNVGAGRNVTPGFLSLDSFPLPTTDILFDLEKCATERIPLPDNSVDEFLISHLVEHIHHILPMMQELYRVATPGAIAIIKTPHGASDSAWGDQTHVRAMFPQSFGFYGQPFYWRADYGYRGDWNLIKVSLQVTGKNITRQTPQEEFMRRLDTERNFVGEMIATMEAVKPMRQPLKELQTPLNIEFLLNSSTEANAKR